jgi:hypothetical protein
VATDNVQLVGLCLIPLLGGIWLERFFDADMKWNDPFTQKAKKMTAVMLTATVVGFFVLILLTDFGGIRAGHAEAYSTYSDPEQWGGNASKILPHLLTLFGVSLKGGTSYVSPSSVINFIRIISLLVILILPMTLFLVYRKIGNRSLKIMLWVHALTSMLIFFLAATGLVGLFNWRLTPMMGTAVMTAIYGLKWMFEAREKSNLGIDKDLIIAKQSGGESQDRPISPIRKRISVICISILALQICVTIGVIGTIPPNYGRGNDIHRNIAFLKAHQLEYGFATFLNAATTTVLSDNEIRVRRTEIFDNKLTYWDWQNDPKWFEDQPGIDRYFLLLSADEYKSIILPPSWETLIEEVLETETGHYVIVFRENPWNHEDPPSEG